MRGRILLGVIGILMLFVILSGISIFINATRFVEVDDSDLICYPQKIDDSQNGYIAMLPVLKEIKKEESYDRVNVLAGKVMTNETGIDYSEVGQLLNQHSSFLSTFSESLKLDSFQAPVEKDISEPIIERYVLEIRFLHHLQVLNIKKLLHEGNMGASAQEILKLFKYGYLLQSSDSGLIYFLIGNMIKIEVLDLIKEWVTKGNFDSAYYKRFLEDTEKYADNNGIINSFKTEYTILANSLRGLVERSSMGDPKYRKALKKYRQNPRHMRYFYNENATIKELAGYYRQYIKNLNGPYADIKHKKISRLSENDLVWYLDCLLTGNSIGKVFLAITVPRLGGLEKGRFEIDARCNLAKLLLAFRAYYADTNTLPDSLHELVPNYIKKTPKDPFDERKLRYSKSEKIIYSVGADMKDDQGDKEKDLRVELNFK